MSNSQIVNSFSEIDNIETDIRTVETMMKGNGRLSSFDIYYYNYFSATQWVSDAVKYNNEVLDYCLNVYHNLISLLQPNQIFSIDALSINGCNPYYQKIVEIINIINSTIINPGYRSSWFNSALTAIKNAKIQDCSKAIENLNNLDIDFSKEPQVVDYLEFLGTLKRKYENLNWDYFTSVAGLSFDIPAERTDNRSFAGYPEKFSVYPSSLQNIIDGYTPRHSDLLISFWNIAGELDISDYSDIESKIVECDKGVAKIRTILQRLPETIRSTYDSLLVCSSIETNVYSSPNRYEYGQASNYVVSIGSNSNYGTSPVYTSSWDANNDYNKNQNVNSDNDLLKTETSKFSYYSIDSNSNNTSGGNSNNTSGGNSNNTSGGNSNNTSRGNSNNTLGGNFSNEISSGIKSSETGSKKVNYRVNSNNTSGRVKSSIASDFNRTGATNAYSGYASSASLNSILKKKTTTPHISKMSVNKVIDSDISHKQTAAFNGGKVIGSLLVGAALTASAVTAAKYYKDKKQEDTFEKDIENDKLISSDSVNYTDSVLTNLGVDDDNQKDDIFGFKLKNENTVDKKNELLQFE